MNEGSRLQEFCKQGLTLLGAGVTEESSGIVSAEMPSSMLDLFEGRPSLRLAFDSEKAGEGIDLVVPGSYVLERLLEAVRLRGGISVLCPAPSVDASPPSAIEILNGEVRPLSSDTLYQTLLLVTFKVSLISDEDQDHLFSVVVDPSTGKRVPLDPSTLLSPPSNAASHSSEDPVPNLRDGFAAARKAVEEFAGETADVIEHATKRRLAREIARLDDYYRGLLSDAGKKSSQDVKRIQRHRERSLTTYTDTEKAFDLARELLSDRPGLKLLEREIDSRESVLRNQIYGLGSIFSKAEKLAALKYDLKQLNKASTFAKQIVRRFHPDDRLGELEKLRVRTLEDVKKKSELEEAAGFDKEALSEIEQLSGRLDSEKARRIAELRDKFQLKVIIKPLSACAVQYPKLVSRYAAVSGSVSIPFTVCRDLVLDRVEPPECRACSQPMSTAYACACGHLVCPACERKCEGCGKEICSDCTAGSCHICSSALCKDCLSTCSVCGKADCHNHSTKCKSCGRHVCKSEGNGSCSITCAICGSDFCREHSRTCPICGSNVCLDDMRKCSKCRKEGCLVDVVDCSCCGKAVCSKHRETCRICGQPVCGSCLSREEGYCSTCRGLFRVKECRPAIESIVAEVAGEKIGRGSRWMASENRSQFILVRRGPLMHVYVLDKTTGALRSRRRLGFFESLLVGLGQN